MPSCFKMCLYKMWMLIVIRPGLDSYFSNEILLTCLCVWVYFSPVVLSACRRNSATGSVEHFPLFKAGTSTYSKISAVSCWWFPTVVGVGDHGAESLAPQRECAGRWLQGNTGVERNRNVSKQARPGPRVNLRYKSPPPLSQIHYLCFSPSIVWLHLG